MCHYQTDKLNKTKPSKDMLLWVITHVKNIKEISQLSFDITTQC